MTLISICTVAILSVLFFGIIMQQKATEKIGYLSTNKQYYVKTSTYFFFALILVLVSASRFGFIDTYAYKLMYVLSNNDLAYVNSAPWDVEAGWLYICYYLNFISHNPKTILLLSAIIIIGAYVILIRKYSFDPLFSLYLFFCLVYLDTNNGLRQMVASAIVIIAFQLLEKGKIWSYIFYAVIIYLAMHLHNSAMICFFIALIVVGKPLNIRTLAALAAGVLFIFIPDFFNNLLGNWFSDSKYLDYLDVSVGMSSMRAIVVAVIPLVLTVLYLNLCKRDNLEIDKAESILINILVVNSVFVLMGLKMQYWARMAFYTEFSTFIMIPKYIDLIFGEEKTKKIVKSLAIILYFGFFAYNVYVNVQYGALDQFYPSWD